MQGRTAMDGGARWPDGRSPGWKGPRMHVVGVNGCPGGWFAITWDVAAGTLIPAVHPSFPDLLAAYPDAAAIGVDIPIGLAADGEREADRAARKALGSPRSSSVFPSPHPAVLALDA